MYEILKPNKYTTVVKIPRADIDKVDVLMADEPVKTMSTMVSRVEEKPDFIINGGLFNMADGKTIVLCIDEGKQIASGYFSRFGLQTYKDGTWQIDEYKWNPNTKDFISSSPSLVKDGKVSLDLTGLEKDGNFVNNKHPRSAVGINDEYFFLVTVDGRRLSKPGMTILQLAKLMIDIGCTKAFNLDGGGSTRLGQVKSGKLTILNSPTENRPVDNFVSIYLKKDIKPTVPVKPTIPPTTITKVLKFGSIGEEVILLQKMLVEAGYILTVDGSFGNATLSLVRAFQAKSGLTTDGIFGPASNKALTAFITQKKKIESNPIPVIPAEVMVPIKRMIDKDDHYAGVNDIQYLVIHDTGNETDTDEGNANFFNTSSRGRSAHYFVDDDSITQIVEDYDGSWHVGVPGVITKIHNKNSIGIEQCRTNGIVTAKTEKNTMDLVIKLMKKYNIPLDRVVRHYDATKKNCPSSFNLDGKWTRWYAFKDKLTSIINVQPSKPTPFTIGEYEKPVVVISSSLNVRSGRGFEHQLVGALKKGDKVTIKYIHRDDVDGKGTPELWGSLIFNGKTAFVTLKYCEPTI